MNKIFYTLIFLIGLSFGSIAQNRLAISGDRAVKLIKYYPNPAVNFINFEFQKGYNKFFSFQIYNFIGKKIIDLKFVTQKINIPVANFYRGVYIYQLRDKTGKIVESGKFQVIK